MLHKLNSLRQDYRPNWSTFALTLMAAMLTGVSIGMALPRPYP